MCLCLCPFAFCLCTSGTAFDFEFQCAARERQPLTLNFRMGAPSQVSEGSVACGARSSRASRDERAQKARLKRLPRASGGTSRRTVTAQRTGTHPQAGSKRRRHIVERCATVAAEFSTGHAHTQPVAARRAFRIDALHSPTGQILHAFLPGGSCGLTRKFFQTAPLERKQTGKTCGNFAPEDLWCQE